MPISLPSHVVPLTLIADIVVCIGTNTLKPLSEIQTYTGKSESYVKAGLDTGKLLGLINPNTLGANDVYPEALNKLGRTPSEQLKTNVMREYVQRFDSFVKFVQYCMNDNAIIEAARKTYIDYDFYSSIGYAQLGKLFTNWGKSTDIFTIQNGKAILNEGIRHDYDTHMNLNLSLDNDMSIRIYIRNRLGEDTANFLEHADMVELIDSYKKYMTEPRDSIGCSGRAFENFLRRFAVKVSVDVTSKNGITQIVNELKGKGKIHSKPHSIAGASGSIRNMAGHGIDPKDYEPWDLSPQSALMYVELVLSTMKSIYLYDANGTLIF